MEADKKPAEFCRLCKNVLDYMRAELGEDEIIIFERESVTILKKKVFADWSKFYKEYPLKDLGLVDSR